ncbi:MAG: FecR domain-containing protein [Candidatus Aminicenantes bacterium]|nr:FecR domain-containing protein [Candidatus Aminicenantes bacterium]
MSRKNFLTMLIVAVSVFTFIFSGTDSVFAGETQIYGHISFVDNDVYVLKSGEDSSLKAVVNLPLVPGDIIHTKKDGRCEIQFDNGTLIRLDEESELKLDTVLAETLTSKKKITTLQLKKGQIFSMNQVYNGEIFQVITTNAAIKMFARSSSTIKVDETGETHVFVERGKVGILYGKSQKSDKKQYVKAGKGCRITKDSDLIPETGKKDIEFQAWNKYINKNFKELHYGKSKVPAVIYRRSPGIVKFAEKWSTKFGTWEYNDLFGYVWKPYADVFKYNRPFWDANYVKVNGEPVLVPNQPWGWAPAHLGTWFFSDNLGWIWIPGDAFSRGICTVGLVPLADDLMDYFYCSSPRCYAFSTLGHWINYIFGDTQLYSIYRSKGSKAWHSAYVNKFKCEPVTAKPTLDGAPVNIKAIIKSMNKAPVEKIGKHIAFNNRKPAFKLDKTRIFKNTGFDKNKSAFLKKRNAGLKKGAPGKGIKGLIAHHGRDWNPDAKWASRVGVKIGYSSKQNAVICPKLGISSKQINNLERNMLRRSVVNRGLLRHSGGGIFAGSGRSGTTGNTASATVQRGNATSGGSGGSGGSSTSGGGGNNSSTKQ